MERLGKNEDTRLVHIKTILIHIFDDVVAVYSYWDNSKPRRENW